MMPFTLTTLALIMAGSWEAAIIVLPILMVLVSLKLFSPMGITSALTPMFSLDSMSTVMIMLTLWISFLMLSTSMKLNYLNFKSDLFLAMTLILCLILTLAFSANNLFAYYVFFEASLIPTLTLILVWGVQPERLEAGTYLMMYTMVASLPLLFSLLACLNSHHTLTFMFPIYTNVTNFLAIGLTFAFLVKMPMYFTHLWLPKAHVEAPVAGSMILASILLKLGAYGILRSSTLFPLLLLSKPFTIIMIISIWGSVLTTILCIRQLDMKAMIAYSSVSHMGLLIAGIMTSSKWGTDGALMMMVAHGLTSSGLFALVNMYYENTYSRSLIINKGFLFISPSMALWWFLALSANMGAPPTINLLAEIMLFQGVISYSTAILPALLLIPFFTVAYSLILFTSLHHGQPSTFIHYPEFIPSYYTTSLLHILPSFLLITCASQISI